MIIKILLYIVILFKIFYLICIFTGDKKGIFINDPLKEDSQILFEFCAWYIIKCKEFNESKLVSVAKKRNFNDLQLLTETSLLSPDQFSNIQSFIPTNMTFVTQYILAITTPDDRLDDYGISQIKKQNLIFKMAEAIQKGIEIKSRLHFPTEKRQALQQHLRNQCNITKLFISRNTSLSTKYLKMDLATTNIAIGIITSFIIIYYL